MSNIKKFVKSSIVYFIGNVLSRLSTFFLLPLYTKYINPADYGYYDVSIAYLSVFTSAMFLDIWVAIMRYMFDYSDGQLKYKPIYNGAIIMFCSFSIYGILALALNTVVEIRYLLLIVIYGIFVCMQNFFSYIARGFGENMVFAGSGLAGTLVNVLSNVVFIVYMKMDYSCLYISFVIGTIVQIVIIETKVKVISNFKTSYIDKKLIISMAKYALPLCLNSVSFWFLTNYNKVVIANQLTTHENGLFAVAGKFAFALTLVSSCFNLAWQEMAFDRGSNGSDIGKFYSTASDLFLRFLLCGTIMLIPIVAIIFPFMVAPMYSESRNIVPMYLLGTMASIYSQFLGNIFGALKQTKTIFISTVFASIVNILVIHSLIGALGVLAATVSLFVGYVVNIIIRVIFLNKKIDFNVNYKLILLTSPIIIFAIHIYANMSLVANYVMLLFAVLFTLYYLKTYIIKILNKVRVRRIRIEN
ncbi:MAG TPA: lipopolysaccharide biosynthesis protein [Methylomusa anaerophila]|uniref:Polysaccharide biosynthesis protein n=1 Tax=Methylomusa anaerophila TaxID=1930071 RepID=A0A348AGC0_9FIRM|nr:lipopolysaccharide biosynthesis protein [Methylomusa anaerophila]BBB90118.1 polysaccharide biosynthesis protein [Methylomusa anaerophila]HML88158.1 lipopolysaccharide biosynthesis protein [Methylomusa anaerophila]